MWVAVVEYSVVESLHKVLMDHHREVPSLQLEDRRREVLSKLELVVELVGLEQVHMELKDLHREVPS